MAHLEKKRIRLQRDWLQTQPLLFNISEDHFLFRQGGNIKLFG